MKRLNFVPSLLFPVLFLLPLSLLLSGCQSAYYSTLEKVGYHKRDILIDRVEDTQQSQEEAQQQFQSALEHFQVVVNFDGGELQTLYDTLKADFDKSQDAAEEVSSRINKVEDVAEALFEEWEGELALYQNQSLKRDSERKLRQTKQKYQQLITAMRRAEKTMQPVLTTFQDQVLYLKHNLNARAIASLKGELRNIQQDINQLIREMQRSIRESKAFIQQLQQG
ncbi:DUF2959 domain-containing protein [Zooshikella marina]|uniref:DUF2959 domain-containing protein n=1 Tax=Zooshikella ganghwensis TaxID=202772 RepID=UPI001BAFA29B|nr:DUF2959 domain-containing protein [Zooshikella ganghwensis]MBU2704815.1 DUF2959 domain-containing protein [Zooshikella ganghwensis]